MLLNKWWSVLKQEINVFSISTSMMHTAYVKLWRRLKKIKVFIVHLPWHIILPITSFYISIKEISSKIIFYQIILRRVISKAKS
jgi:hypothetical protein